MKVTLEIPLFAGIGSWSIPFLRKRTLHIPTRWAELKDRHLPAVEQLLFDLNGNDKGDLARIAAAICRMMARWMGIDELWAQTDPIAANRRLISIGVELAADTKHDTPLHRRTLWMQGVGEKLINMRYQQFIYAERIYAAYVQERSHERLAQLAAISTRCQWLPYAHWLSEWRYHLYRFMPRRKLLRIAFCYMGQRAHLPEMYPELYRRSGPKGDELAIDQQILGQCGTELGGFRQVARTPLHLVLELMQMKEREFIKNNPKHALKYATVEDLYASVGKRPPVDRSR